MKHLLSSAAILLLVSATTFGQTIIADDFNIANVGTGFLLGEGVNSGINPPTTRLTGTAAPDLRYLSRTSRADSSYYITSASNGRLRANAGAQNGRVTLSADGTDPFDFGSALGIPLATPADPVVYDITISMDNNDTGTHRMSLGFGTVEGDATTWDFGIQIYKAASGDDFYTVARRIDTGSSGLASDLNSAVFTMDAGTAATEVSFLLRVTDAGAEASAFSSWVQASLDGGTTWFYDTRDDAALSGWRFDGAGRYFSMDLAGGNSSFVTFDNFSVTVITAAVPEPSTLTLGLLAGIVGLIWRRW
jgi:hypothetical protein